MGDTHLVCYPLDAPLQNLKNIQLSLFRLTIPIFMLEHISICINSLLNLERNGQYLTPASCSAPHRTNKDMMTSPLLLYEHWIKGTFHKPVFCPVCRICNRMAKKKVRTDSRFIQSHYHTIILSYYHTIILSYYHTIILSYNHTIILAYYHTIILSHYHTITLSYYHTITRSYYHTIILSHYHTIIL